MQNNSQNTTDPKGMRSAEDWYKQYFDKSVAVARIDFTRMTELFGQIQRDAIAAERGENAWKETVRDIYDQCVTGQASVACILDLIEHRHADYFCAPIQPSKVKS